MSKSEDLVLFDSLCAVIRGKVPGFKIRFKNESRWQKFLGKLLFFDPGYMIDTVTTLGTTVWFPSREFLEKDRWVSFKILAHEYVHLLDRKERPVLFELFYAFPHFLALFSLAAIAANFYSNLWLYALCTLVFLLPLPSFGRAQLEVRAYAMNLAINMWRHGYPKTESIEQKVGYFSSWQYYKMWPFKGMVRSWFEDYIVRIQNINSQGPRGVDVIFNDSDAYADVYGLMTGIEF
jgi:hypothetical protein